AVDQAETDQELAFKINALGPKYLALACKASNAVLIHISTDFVFDGCKTSPYTETDTPNPINAYGRTKLQGENSIVQTTEQYIIIRTSWLYSEYGHNFMKTMLRLSKTRSEISVVNDQVGSPTYAGDLATAILKIIDSKTIQYGLYHYSNTVETSWYDFAKTIFKFANKDVKVNPIASAHYPTLAKRPNYSVLQSEKLLEQFNIKASRWESHLKKVLEGLT
ncbi:dTDP-4-dehydrorhamnose reductase, partial [Seonamhaeicola marinus]